MEKDRKKDHIELALQTREKNLIRDERFYYEPLLGRHPHHHEHLQVTFLGKELNYPIWISSMTGGTKKAKKINQNLAKAAREFRIGMGIGSCRPLLDSQDRLEDFDIRGLIGDDLPFYGNLGIAQVNELLEKNEVYKINNVMELLRTDGLIIHINPLQEWNQEEGDSFKESPLNIIKSFLGVFKYPVIVKEVGQGMGPKSLLELLKLNIKGIDFGAFGGTNFSLIESIRRPQLGQFDDAESLLISNLGHTTGEMISFMSKLPKTDKEFIVSGGIKDFLDGYYSLKKMKSIGKSVYGLGGVLLPYAEKSYDDLAKFLEKHTMNLKLSYQFLTLRDE